MDSRALDSLVTDADQARNKARYHKTRKIGEGTYAVVYVGKDMDTGSTVAIKKIKLINADQGLDFSTIREIKWLRELIHPNIIRLLDVFALKSSVHLILEYSAWNLEMLIQDKHLIFMPSDVKYWMLMLLRAVDYCHQNWVLHRDIKPNNLLISEDGALKLADFGLSRDFGNVQACLTSKVVTRWYQAPELLFGCKVYTGAVDMWSVGCVFAELMLRKPYLPGDSDIGQLKTIFRVLGTPTEVDWPGMTLLPNYIELAHHPKPSLRDQFTAATNDALDLLSRMLTPDPAKRICAREALLHPYFRNHPYPTHPSRLPKPQSKDNS